MQLPVSFFFLRLLRNCETSRNSLIRITPISSFNIATAFLATHGIVKTMYRPTLQFWIMDVLMYHTAFNVLIFLVYSLLRGELAPAARTARQPRPLCGGATGTVTRCATPAGSTTNSTAWVLRAANTESDSEVVKWADSLYRLRRGKTEAGDAKPAFPVRQSPLTVFFLD